MEKKTLFSLKGEVPALESDAEGKLRGGFCGLDVSLLSEGSNNTDCSGNSSCSSNNQCSGNISCTKNYKCYDDTSCDSNYNAPCTPGSSKEDDSPTDTGKENSLYLSLLF